MKKNLMFKTILTLTVVGILFGTLSFVAKASDDPIDKINKIREECGEYCSDITDEYLNWACMKGCIAGSSLFEQ